MSAVKKYFMLLFCLQVFLVSCSNVFIPLADKNSDAALYEDGIKSLNSKDWDAAILKFEAIKSNNFKKDPDYVMNLAGAYAGKCGFVFIEFLDTLTQNDPSGTTIFKYLMNVWTNKPTERAFCSYAINVVRELSPSPLNRTSSQSFFLVLMGMAKLGIYLKELTDVNPRDGVVDSSPFDMTDPTQGFCVLGNFSDENVAEIGTSMALVLGNLANVGTALDSSQLDLSDVTTACNAAGAPPNNPCYYESNEDFTQDANNIKFFRSLMNIESSGVGLVNGTQCL